MIKIDLNWKFKGLDGKEMVGEDEAVHAGKFLASALSAQVVAISGHLQYVDNPEETFEQLVQELILENYLNPMITSQIRNDEVKKIEAVIEQKVSDTVYVRPTKIIKEDVKS